MEEKSQYITIDTEKEYSLKELVSILRAICKSQRFFIDELHLRGGGFQDLIIKP